MLQKSQRMKRNQVSLKKLQNNKKVKDDKKKKAAKDASDNL